MKEKSFKVISAQIERIYSLYLKGYGTKRMIEKCESIFFANQNVGLCY